jgi:ferredoxin
VALTARLRVDPVACDAFGHCAELAPELIWLDEWGYPVVDDRPVPAELLGVADTAVRACPRKALLLQEMDRRVSRSR